MSGFPQLPASVVVPMLVFAGVAWFAVLVLGAVLVYVAERG